jgi:Lipase (class 3)
MHRAGTQARAFNIFCCTSRLLERLLEQVAVQLSFYRGDCNQTTMKTVVRTVSIKSTIPDYTAKYEAAVDGRFKSVPFCELSEHGKHAGDEEARIKQTIHCTHLRKGVVGEVVRGLVYASLAITDDKDKTLHNSCKKSPWDLETFKAITGSRTKAHKPLSQILEEDMNLEVDEHIDVSGRTRSGQAVDTHGYIAHNDEIIVLAYSCSTSAFDWLATVPTASSTWDVDKDFGYSGYFSRLECFSCGSDDFKPCVNSEFYHRFLASLPAIRRKIEPLLAADQPPRKLFVAGHSLGAGVATLAACYFMLEFDWTILPHSLVMVTAGSPRSCCRSMKEVIDERRLKMGSSVRLYRVVKGQDIVAAFPPSTAGFTHIVPKIFIADGGTIFQEEEALFDEEQEVASVLEDCTRATLTHTPAPILMKGSTKYDRFLAKMPNGLRDHLPDA